MPRQPGGGLGHHPHRGVSPYQATLGQLVERGRHHGFGGTVGDQREQLGDRYGSRVGVQDQQRVEDRERDEVQVVGGGLDRLTGLRSHCQRGDAARRRLREVGS
jgi:hypothetical protein